jgi:hypothetical protein
MAIKRKIRPERRYCVRTQGGWLVLSTLSRTRAGSIARYVGCGEGPTVAERDADRIVKWAAARKLGHQTCLVEIREVRS